MGGGDGTFSGRPAALRLARMSFSSAIRKSPCSVRSCTCAAHCYTHDNPAADILCNTAKHQVSSILLSSAVDIPVRLFRCLD